MAVLTKLGPGDLATCNGCTPDNDTDPADELEKRISSLLRQNGLITFEEKISGTNVWIEAINAQVEDNLTF